MSTLSGHSDPWVASSLPELTGACGDINGQYSMCLAWSVGLHGLANSYPVKKTLLPAPPCISSIDHVCHAIAVRKCSVVPEFAHSLPSVAANSSTKRAMRSGSSKCPQCPDSSSHSSLRSKWTPSLTGCLGLAACRASAHCSNEDALADPHNPTHLQPLQPAQPRGGER